VWAVTATPTIGRTHSVVPYALNCSSKESMVQSSLDSDVVTAVVVVLCDFTACVQCQLTDLVSLWTGCSGGFGARLDCHVSKTLEIHGTCRRTSSLRL